MKRGYDMSFKIGFKIGEKVTREKIENVIKCQKKRGIAFSKTNNALAIISDLRAPKSLYNDRWDDDILYYIGSGKRGDQELSNKSNNLKIVESQKRGIKMYLFEGVAEESDYVYRGRVILAAEYFEEEQEDEKGIKRRVYVFPLKVVDNLI